MEDKEQEKPFTYEVKEKTETMVKNILNSDEIPYEKVKILGELIDIHKDMCEEEKYEEEIKMRYSEYGNYNNDPYGRRMRDSRGRYMENGNFGRRGVDSRYRGEETLEDMHQSYQEYYDGKEMYGTDSNTMKALEYMLKLDKKFIKMLEQDAKTPEEQELIRQHKMEMAEM